MLIQPFQILVSHNNNIFIKIFRSMKQVFILLTACCLCVFSVAQTRTTTTEYQKVSRSALVNEVPFPAKTVEDAIEDALSKKGYKGAGSKGFTVYKGVRLAEMGNDPYDLYFMVDKKSKKDKDNSIITMMVSKGFDEFVTESSEGNPLAKAKVYMDSLRNTLASYDLEQQINVQEDEVKKADKKNENLQEDEKDLLKKKKKLEDDIDDNKKAQEKQGKELEKQKQILETLKGKRKQG